MFTIKCYNVCWIGSFLSVYVTSGEINALLDTEPNIINPYIYPINASVYNFS